jgi:hypothetical protein
LRRLRSDMESFERQVKYRRKFLLVEIEKALKN